MKKKYKLEQFPKNKEIEVSQLSNHQLLLRIKSEKKIYKYNESKICNKCRREQPIAEFYVRDNSTGQRRNECRDCKLKLDGVIEIGKQRFADKILAKNFKRCTTCKNIMPVQNFAKSKRNLHGLQASCRDCLENLHSDFWKKQREELGESYIKAYGKNKGILEFTDEIVATLREEIIEKRKPKFFIDGKEFVTMTEFAKYIEDIYGLPYTTTERRIQNGRNEEDCKMSETDMRKKCSGTNKGIIVITDMITNEVFEFENTSDPKLLLMFDRNTITRCIKTGNRTRVTKASKYQNPCIIKRL